MERGASTAQGTFEAMILQRLPDYLPYLIPSMYLLHCTTLGYVLTAAHLTSRYPQHFQSITAHIAYVAYQFIAKFICPIHQGNNITSGHCGTAWPDGLRTARAAHFCVPVTPRNDPTEQPYPADAMQQRLHTTDTHQTRLGSLPSRPIITSNQRSLAAHIISEEPCGFSSRLCPMRPGLRRSRFAYSVRLSHLSEVQLR